MTRQLSVLAPVLRSEMQARLLAALLLHPDREASIAELSREIGADPGNLHSEIERLVDADILSDRRVGRTRLVRATREHPIVRPLTDLLLVGYGPKAAVENALREIPAVARAFIGGSWAARYHGINGPFPRDVDVIIIGTPDRDDASETITEALRTIGHDAQVVFRTPEAWDEARDAFTRTAKAGSLVELAIEPT